MAGFSSIIFLSFLIITIVIIKPFSCALPNVDKKLKPDESFSLVDKITSFTDKSQETGRLLFYTKNYLLENKRKLMTILTNVK